jgi:hypothetical protein
MPFVGIPLIYRIADQHQLDFLLLLIGFHGGNRDVMTVGVFERMQGFEPDFLLWSAAYLFPVYPYFRPYSTI